MARDEWILYATTEISKRFEHGAALTTEQLDELLVELKMIDEPPARKPNDPKWRFHVSERSRNRKMINSCAGSEEFVEHSNDKPFHIFFEGDNIYRIVKGHDAPINGQDQSFKKLKRQARNKCQVLDKLSEAAAIAEDNPVIKKLISRNQKNYASFAVELSALADRYAAMHLSFQEDVADIIKLIGAEKPEGE